MNEYMWQCFEQSLALIKCSVAIRCDNQRHMCVWPAMDLFCLLPWSSQRLLWINVGKTLKQTVFMWKPTMLSTCFRHLSCICLGLILCCGFLAKWIHLETLRNFLLVQGRWFGMLLSLCVFSEKIKHLNFREVTGQGISCSFLILLQKSDFEDWVLRTTHLTWVFPTPSLTVSSVPALGIVNPLVLASCFVPKGSRIFSKEREWDAEE